MKDKERGETGRERRGWRGFEISATYDASATFSPSSVSIVPLTYAFRPLTLSNFVRITTNYHHYISRSYARPFLICFEKNLLGLPYRVF